MKFSASLPLILIALLWLTGCSSQKEENSPTTSGPATSVPAASTQQDDASPGPGANQVRQMPSDFFEVVDEQFVLPETDDLTEIKRFANMLTKSEPTGFPQDSEGWERYFKLQRQYHKALYDTGVKIYEHADATEKDKTNALKMQAKGLAQIAGFDADTYLEKLRELAEELEKNPATEKVALTCWAHYHQNHMALINPEVEKEAYQTAVDQALEFVERHENDAAIASLVSFLSSFLAFNSDESVAEANALRLQEILESSDVPMFKNIAANIPNTLEQGKALRNQTEERQKQNAQMEEGIARREALPGKEMEFECVLLSGDKLNLKDLEGKVVLVDFWATWCGPCIGEIPGMLAVYEKYHDEGFEILGYSTDKDIDALKDFMAERQLPWHIGSRLMSIEAGLTNYSTHYGVTGIPTMILVGKDGKVVSIRARGETLRRELENIFGH